MRTPAKRELAARGLTDLGQRNWTAQRAQTREKVLSAASAVPIDPRFLLLRIDESLPTACVVVEEALPSAQSLLSLLPFRDARCYYGLASGGIGFAMAGAIGIQLAQPQRPVVAIVGNGSAMYSIQALWTAAHLRLPITYVIANNRSYRILKERVLPLQGNTSEFVGMDLRDPAIDFVGLGQSLGVAAERVTAPNAIEPALRKAFDHPGPSLLEIIVQDGFND